MSIFKTFIYILRLSSLCYNNVIKCIKQARIIQVTIICKIRVIEYMLVDLVSRFIEKNNLTFNLIYLVCQI